MTRKYLSGFLAIMVLILGPVAGVMLSGKSIQPYLKFPPATLSIEQPGFSWIAFIAVLLFVVITTLPFWIRFFRKSLKFGTVKNAPAFPWWGWFSLAGLAVFWILAWTRFPWFEPFQRHTFYPLWFCFIIVLNAIAFRISGKSLLLHRPLFFWLLFPVSAAFWWIFEFLNRFVNNWYYTGVDQIGPWQYFGEASLAFSTVLPAVISLRFILLRLPVFTESYRNFPVMPWLKSGMFWGLAGIFSLAGLIATGLKPEFTFPLLWIVPGLLWITFQVAKGYITPLLQDASNGDLTLIWSSAIAALVCGFFWEMWNFWSEAKWIYNIPGVERFYLFEMPVLGYAGYLPFGVICALISSSLLCSLHQKERIIEEEIEKRD